MKKQIFIFLVAVAAIYGLGRLYYRLTDGFTIGNITATFAYHPEWETTPLNVDEENFLEEALNQPYTYLAKGCQAYVFQSQDGKYVVKFFKYQRFRLKPWEEYLLHGPSLNPIDSRSSSRSKKSLSVSSLAGSSHSIISSERQGLSTFISIPL
jgi:hypothetical protein